MSSRKRKNSRTPEIEKSSSKRAKLLSNLWQSEEEIPSSLGPDSSNLSYTIRAVIGETSTEYLIEWEDDPISGKKYTPDWQPKKNVNEVAVAAWKHKNLSRGGNSSARVTRKRRRKRTSDSESNRTTSDESDRTLKKFPKRTFDTSSRVHQDQRTEFDISHRPLSFDGFCSLPECIVQISQHSSFDRDQYIRYQSSVSVSVLSSSFPQHRNSGLGDSSPPPQISDQYKFEKDRVIPDSQPLPGSSSYAPTSITTGSTCGLTQPVVEKRIFTPSPNSTDFTSSNLLVAGASDPIEDSPNPAAALSLSCVANPRRSKSTPSDTSDKITGAAPSTPSPISHSASDPGLIAPDHRHHQSWPTGDSTQQETSSIAADLPGLPNVVSWTHTSPRSIAFGRTHVRGSILSGYPSIQSQVSEIASPELDQDFQTQVPVASGSQASHVSAASAEDIWQSGQVVLKPVDLTSQSSSTSADHRSTAPIQASQVLVDDVYVEAEHYLHSSSSEAFLISENLADDSQRTQATDSSVLSQRDPNPQSERHPHSAETKEDVSLPPVEHADQQNIPISSPLLDSLQLPVTIDSRPSPPLPSASTFEMSETPQSQTAPSPRASQLPAISGGPAKASLRERLREMRTASAAAAAANAAARKSNLEQIQSPRVEPSPPLIPKQVEPPNPIEARIEVQPMEVPVEVPLPVRVPQSGPHTPTQPSKLSFHTEISYSQVTTSLNPANLGEMEFVIPLPMNTRVRDQYVTTVNCYGKDITNLMKDEMPDTALIDRIREMLNRVNLVTTHVDLLDSGDSSAQQQVSAEDEANWAAICSAKFHFLKHLLDTVRHLPLHIAIVASGKPGRVLDIIETFLQGRHVVYNRPDTLTRSETRIAKGRVEVSLIGSREHGATVLPDTADLTIAFDGSFDPGDVQVDRLRGPIVKVGQLFPVVHLLVYNSAEHIERCLPRDMEPVERLRRIVSCMTQTRHEVGVLLPDEPGSLAAAEEVAAFLEAGGLEKDWTFPSIRPIEGIEVVESSQDADSSTQSETHLDEQIATPQPSRMKRALDYIENSADMPKRKKTTPAPTVEITHISDSATQESQIYSQTKGHILNLENALADVRRELTVEQNELAVKTNSFKSQLSITESRLHEFTSALAELQGRFEARNTAYYALRHEKADLMAAAVTAESKRDLQATEILTLKTDRTRLEQDLQTVRTALLDSSNPGIAELERANSAVRALQQETARLEKKNESLSKDFDFTRQQYQVASTAAAEASTQVQTLTVENMHLRQKCSGEAAKLAEINNTDANAQHRARVNEVEAELREVQVQLRRKEEELRDLRRGRGGVQTRGSSVQPRSPRNGGVGAGNGGSSGGNGSRGGSPVPGGLLATEMRRGGSGLRFS